MWGPPYSPARLVGHTCLLVQNGTLGLEDNSGYYYRPQTKFGANVMFSQECFSHSVHRREGSLSRGSP